MKIIENRIIPFGSYKAMVLGKFIFTKNASRLSDRIIRHETIHYYQQAELAYIIFFVMYFLSFLTQFARCLFSKNIGRVETGGNSVWNRAYRTIVFEREAYENEDNPEYLKTRKPWAWVLLKFYV